MDYGLVCSGIAIGLIDQYKKPTSCMAETNVIVDWCIQKSSLCDTLYYIVYNYCVSELEREPKKQECHHVTE